MPSPRRSGSRKKLGTITQEQISTLFRRAVSDARQAVRAFYSDGVEVLRIDVPARMRCALRELNIRETGRAAYVYNAGFSLAMDREQMVLKALVDAGGDL